MRKYELIKALQSTLKVFADNDIDARDWRYVQMYEDYERLRKEGHKYIYIMRYLSQQYETSESTLYRIIKKYEEDVIV